MSILPRILSIGYAVMSQLWRHSNVCNAYKQAPEPPYSHLATMISTPPQRRKEGGKARLTNKPWFGAICQVSFVRLSSSIVVGKGERGEGKPLIFQCVSLQNSNSLPQILSTFLQLNSSDTDIIQTEVQNEYRVRQDNPVFRKLWPASHSRDTLDQHILWLGPSIDLRSKSQNMLVKYITWVLEHKARNYNFRRLWI